MEVMRERPLEDVSIGLIVSISILVTVELKEEKLVDLKSIFKQLLIWFTYMILSLQNGSKMGRGEKEKF